MNSIKTSLSFDHEKDNNGVEETELDHEFLHDNTLKSFCKKVWGKSMDTIFSISNQFNQNSEQFCTTPSIEKTNENTFFPEPNSSNVLSKSDSSIKISNTENKILNSQTDQRAKIYNLSVESNENSPNKFHIVFKNKISNDSHLLSKLLVNTLLFILFK